MGHFITLHPLLVSFLLVLIAFAVNEDAFFCHKTDKCIEKTVLDRDRYDFYRLYYVELASEQHMQLFQQLQKHSDSCSFYGHGGHPELKLTVMVAPHKVADFADRLKVYKVMHRILDKIDKNLAEVLSIGADLKHFDGQHYFDLDTIYAWMEQLALRYPDELTLLDIGTSSQGVNIKGLKLARNKHNKAIFIESGIHAREWIAPAAATYLINELFASKEVRIQRLASDYNWIVFPVVNPDGYKYTFEGDRMWRKNRQLFGICRGVDLNRNYPNHWNTTGCSGDRCRYDYSGPAAGSEIETQRLMQYVTENKQKERISTFLSLHSYSQLIMFPYSNTAETAEHYADLSAIGKRAAENIKQLSVRVYKTGSVHETIYPSSGDSKDWAYEDMKIPVTFGLELRRPPDSQDLFILPAAEITPAAEEAFAAITTIVEEAENRGYYQ